MLKEFLLTLTTFLAIDAVWLGLIARGLYDKHLESFARVTRLPAIPIIYLILTFGIVILVFPKAGSNPKLALLYGAIYGLVAYGVYDLTNYATLKNWSLTMVVTDIAWGMFICGVVAFVTTYLINRPPFRA